MNGEKQEEPTRTDASLSSQASDMLATPFSGITFRVNEVTPEGDPFEVVPSVDTINDYLQPPAWLTEEVQRNTSATLDEKQQGDLQSADLAKKSTPKIETCSRPRGELCSGMSCHLLVNVIAAACRSHRPVEGPHKTARGRG